MKVIERYIFRRMLSALVLTFVALGTMVWLAQAVRQFNLVTASGQSLLTFLHVSLLLVPVLVTIVLPFAALIAVIYTLTNLNGDSELAVINASGAPQFAILKPVLLIGLITAVGVGAMSLYFAPLATRLGESLVASVRGNVLSTIINPGQFMALGDGLTFHMRGRNPDGSLNGIFVVDDRDPTRTTTYLADKGAILDNPLGVFLVMSNGVIQQRNKIDQAISMIEFSSYAFDLSTLTSGREKVTVRPRERSTVYLLHPDPDDPYFQQHPEQLRSELHGRITMPLYGLAFVVLPLLFIGQADSPRESRAASVAMLVALVMALGAIGLFLPTFAMTNAALIVLMYVVPLGVIAISAALVLVGAQVRPPERVVALGEALFGRVSGLLRPDQQPSTEGTS
jgi:lipopolysaccharide export system permease protein